MMQAQRDGRNPVPRRRVVHENAAVSWGHLPAAARLSVEVDVRVAHPSDPSPQLAALWQRKETAATPS